ncbi:hypothetical protein GVAV_000610 [Gurleya vavrai]
MNAFNIFIGGFPLLVLFYHLILFLFRVKNNDIKLLKLFGIIVYSRFLKSIFKVTRNKTIKKDFFYYGRLFMNAVGSDYSFPSSHIVFYTSYFLTNFKFSRIIIVLIACFARVFYKHHKIEDVIFGVFFGIIFNILFSFIENIIVKKLNAKNINENN